MLSHEDKIAATTYLEELNGMRFPRCGMRHEALVTMNDLPDVDDNGYLIFQNECPKNDRKLFPACAHFPGNNERIKKAIQLLIDNGKREHASLLSRISELRTSINDTDIKMRVARTGNKTNIPRNPIPYPQEAAAAATPLVEKYHEYVTEMEAIVHTIIRELGDLLARD